MPSPVGARAQLTGPTPPGVISRASLRRRPHQSGLPSAHIQAARGMRRQSSTRNPYRDRSLEEPTSSRARSARKALATLQAPQSARRQDDGEDRGDTKRDECPDEEESSAGLGDLA